MRGGRSDRIRPGAGSSRRRFEGEGAVGAALSAHSREVLRGIRDMVDDNGVFAGTDEDAAAAAGVSVDIARGALRELSGRRMIQLRRASAPRVRAAQPLTGSCS